MSVNDKLLPCPCCGSKAEMQWGRPDLSVWIAYAKCTNCGMSTRNCYGKNDREAAKEALEAWNERI